MSNYNYKLLERQAATESLAYFVLEHQPASCEQLPANGKVSWTNIVVEVRALQHGLLALLTMSFSRLCLLRSRSIA